MTAGVPRREGDDVEVAKERPHKLEPAAVVDPRVLLPLVHAEGQGRVERKGLVLADEVVAGRVGALHRALLHGVDRAERGHDFARAEYADLELAAGDRG